MTESRNFSKVPEKQPLQPFLDKLISLRNLLLYESDLRTINPSIINTLEADLKSISMKVERVLNNSNTIFISLDAFEAEIRLAREELYTASNALEKSDRMSNMRLFYKSLNNCGQHINQALQLVVDNQ